MAVPSQFIAVATNSSQAASSAIYIVDWILALVLSLAFVFYFGRLAGFLISCVAKIVLWNRYSIEFNVESFRVSVLGGRIMMKNLTVITENQTVSILRLNFTWRYWIWGLLRIPEYFIDHDIIEPTGITKRENEKLKTKFLLLLEGLEVFMYNRAFAYDTIEEILLKEQKARHKDSQESSSFEKKKCSNLRQRASKPRSSCEDDNNGSFSQTSSSTNSSVDQDATKILSKSVRSLNMLLKFLPVSVGVKKAAIIMGNVSTPSILLASCTQANGIFDIAKTANVLDVYQNLSLFELEKFRVSLKPNIAYNPSRYSEAHPNPFVESKVPTQHHTSNLERLLEPINNMASIFFKRRNIPSSDNTYTQWAGLNRYRGEKTDEYNLLETLHSNEEYAKYSLILETVATKVSYHYDIPGIHSDQETAGPPEYVMDLEFSAATIHYGAWADKQRVPLQSMFFPSIARDSKPTPPLKIGQLRRYEGFKVNITTNDEIIFRVPTRELSKDKEVLKGPANAPGHQNEAAAVRPFGWLELKMAANSTMSAFTSFICTEQGWANKVSAFFNAPEIRSSVNHDILYLAKTHYLDCDVGFPKAWNGECVWSFNNVSTEARMFFLREHTLLLSDIFADFGSGAPTPYEQFRPFTYNFKWEMAEYKIYLNVNDSNIINNPLDFSSNRYISAQGDDITINVSTPLLGQFTTLTTVDYKVFTPKLKLVLDNPPWHTGSAFMGSSYTIGQSKAFSVEGSYSYYDSIEVNLSNTIIIRCIGDDVTLKFYGFVMKYIFVIKENYMGDTFHFKTFEEYNESVDSHTNHEDTNSMDHKDYDYWNIIKAENNVDILFSFQVRNALLVLPQNIYSCQSHIGLLFDYFDVDIRFTNFFMDMEADFSPVQGYHVQNDEKSNAALFDIPLYKDLHKSPDILIDSLTIHGHRMFGVPPHEITYYCNWRVATDSITIDSDPSILIGLGNVASRFLFSFHDMENALHVTMPTIYDALSFTFDCPIIEIKIRCAEDDPRIAKISLNAIVFNFNDFANSRYSTKLSLLIPLVTIVVENEIDKRIYAHIDTKISLENFTRKKNYHEHRRLQQEHIHLNDAPFHRCPFLLFDETKDEIYESAYGSLIVPTSLLDVHPPLTIYTGADLSFEGESELDDDDNSFDEEAIKGLYMPPTQNYNEDEMAPESENDSRFKYDDFIIMIDTVTVLLTPKGLEFKACLDEKLLQISLDNLIDDIELTTVNGLKKVMLEVCVEDKFRIASPQINIQFADLYKSTKEEMIEGFKTVPSITIDIIEPSIALSESIERKKQPTTWSEDQRSSGAVSLKQINVSITNPTDSNRPVRLDLNDLEVWFDKDDEESVVSVNLSDVSLDFEVYQLVWLIRLFSVFSEALAPFIEKSARVSSLRKNQKAYLVYQLAIATDEHKVDYDPGVITKPAYMLRSLEEHIRFFDSWLVITRFRHLYTNMPKEWKQKVADNDDFSLPDDAFDEALDRFCRWRSWEADFEQREQFFAKLFNFKQLSQQKTILQTVIKNVVVKLTNKKFVDFIHIADFTFSVLQRATEANFARLNKDLEEDYDANVRAMEVLVNVQQYDSRISNVVIDVMPEVLAEVKKVIKPAKATASNPKGAKKVSNQAYAYTANFTSFSQELSLDGMGILLKSIDFCNGGVIQEIENEILFSACSRFTKASIELYEGHSTIVSYEVENAKMILSCMNETKFHFVDVHIDNCNVIAENQKLYETAVKVQKTVNRLRSLFKDENIAVPAHGETKKQESFNIKKLAESLTATVNIQVDHLSWSIDVLKPLKISGKVYDNNFSLILKDGTVDVGSLIQRTDMKLLMNNLVYLEIEGSQLFNNLKLSEYNDILMMLVDLHLGFTKISFNEAAELLDACMDNYDRWMHEVDRIKALIPEKSIKTQTDHNVTSKENGAKLAIDFRIANDYFGLTFIVNRVKYSLAIEDFEAELSNISATGTPEIVKYYGSVVTPTTRISVIDRTIPVGLSNVVDFHVNVNLKNDEKKAGYSLEVQSHHCRVCLSVNVIKCLVSLTDTLTVAFERLSSKTGNPKTPINEPPPKVSGEAADNILNISSIHVLAYNFCVGWIFENARKDYPGMIFGSERFYAVTDEKLGKLSLMESYLSVAHGSKASTFFSTQSEKTNSNRAFLPLMQYVYTIKEVEDSREMRINIMGDELDVIVLPDVVLVSEYIVKSVSVIQDFLTTRQKPERLTKLRVETDGSDYINTIRSSYSCIECRANFAGSNVLIHSAEDEGTSFGSSLFLHFPAVKTVSYYQHKPEAADAKHVIKCEILTTSSDNTLHASCNPVVAEIADNMKYMMRNQAASKPKSSDVKESNNGVNFGRILKEMDIHVGLTIEKQRLALSCEPTAKVEAVVGIDGIFLQVNSNNKTSPAINIDASFGNISASLQHIYSREVSGSIAIPAFLLTTALEFADYLNVLSAVSISDLNSYVNVKQYQDLELFKDIWFPKTSNRYDSVHKTEREKLQLSDNKGIAMRFKEVSTTSAVPWFFTIILTNFSLRVHFGPSLGNAFFKIDQLSILSTKTTDWSQRLKLGINSAILSCEGRLGGSVVANDIFLHTGINWKMDDGTTLDVPLIIVSGGIDKLQLKITFDYHLIAVAKLSNFSVDVYNKKSEQVISKDHLFVGVKFDVFEVFITSFTAANTLDIYHAILRMIHENQVSYKETLGDSNRDKSDPKGRHDGVNHNDILETVKILETEFEVIAGALLIHVYPSSFADSKVLVVNLDKSRATFSQNEFHRGISNQLDVQFNDLTVSLSLNSQISEDFIQDCTVDEFTDYAHRARGGNLFVFPSFQISMKTFQGYRTNLIEYLYQSTFGGAVDVRWNLGSVNFIREMYAIHTNSLATRIQVSKELAKGSGEIEFRQDMFTTEADHAVGGGEEIDPMSEIDQVINQTIDKVSKGSKYSYLPLAPPIIEAPQLKELGNATPPLEWFGLHRNKFPNVTHGLAIVSLQRVIHEIEREYSRILGKA